MLAETQTDTDGQVDSCLSSKHSFGGTEIRHSYKSFDRDEISLTLSPMTIFWTGPNSKHSHMTNAA